MRIGVPKEIKVHEYRVGLVPASGRELVDAGHEVLVETGGAAGHRRSGRGLRARRREDRGERRRGLRRGRDDREGEGAAAEGVRDAAQGPDPVHLPPPRAGSEADRGAGQVGRDLHRLRDGHRRRTAAAAAHADERSRRPHVDPGRRVLPGEGERRPRRAAGRRAGRCGRRRSSILGGGVVGTNAAEMAVGLRADVTVVDRP